MPKKGELPPWLRKRKTKLSAGKTKKGTKDKKLADARDAAAAAAAKDVQKGKRKALVRDISEPDMFRQRRCAEQQQSKPSPRGARRWQLRARAARAM